MQIAVIGRGSVGGTLAQAWAGAGHEVTLGVRSPGSGDLAELPIAEAAAAADVVVLAVPWAAIDDAVAAAGDLSGKIVLDATNPMSAVPTDAGGKPVSGGEYVQSRAAGAAVFKVFNTTGFNIMEDPVLEGRPSLMLFCGNDDARRGEVTALVRDVGFDAVDAGPIGAADLLEAMAQLWIRLAYQQGLGRDIAFALLRRQ